MPTNRPKLVNDAISFEAAKLSRGQTYISTTKVAMPPKPVQCLSVSCAASFAQARPKARSTSKGGPSPATSLAAVRWWGGSTTRRIETKEKGNEAYAELLTARCGDEVQL